MNRFLKAFLGLFFGMSSPLPRSGSLMFSIMRGSSEDRRLALKKFHFWNKFFIIPLYRVNILPLFFLSRFFLLLYTRGRKSGLRRITPVEFRKYQEHFLLFSSRGTYADWFNNLVANPDAALIKKGFRKFRPSFEVLSDLQEKISIMSWYASSFPGASKQLFGFDKSIDEPSDALFRPIAEFIEIVKFKL